MGTGPVALATCRGREMGPEWVWIWASPAVSWRHLVVMAGIAAPARRGCWRGVHDLGMGHCGLLGGDAVTLFLPFKALRAP